MVQRVLYKTFHFGLPTLWSEINYLYWTTTDIIKSLESGDNSITKTSYIDEEQMKKIRDSITSCNLEIGNENYKDYIWPTMLSFMTKKWVK